MSSFFSWDLVWEFFPKILSALPVTLLIVGIATLVGLVLGSFIAFIRVEKIPILNQLAAVFVSFIRGTPILVQLYIVYYGVPSLLQAIQIDVSSWDKIIFIYITYGLNTAAFQSETIRAAILSVPTHAEGSQHRMWIDEVANVPACHSSASCCRGITLVWHNDRRVVAGYIFGIYDRDRGCGWESAGHWCRDLPHVGRLRWRGNSVHYVEHYS
jgi:His/Glu/Gln/Arg/opine family amino acid ABC transporter permease subunit